MPDILSKSILEAAISQSPGNHQPIPANHYGKKLDKGETDACAVKLGDIFVSVTTGIYIKPQTKDFALSY